MKDHFELLNVSNILDSEEKYRCLCNIFKSDCFTLADMYGNNVNNEMGYTTESFRKLMNHTCIIGVLEKIEYKYCLSNLSIEFYNDKMSFKSYILRIIGQNENLKNNVNIILNLLSLFNGELSKKTVYAIFSYVYKNRLDDSSIASVGRNLRSVFTLMELADLISKSRSSIKLRRYPHVSLEPMSEVFDSDIISINDLKTYMSEYFTTEVSIMILKCLSTFEVKNYIWTKSSLFKDIGEIENFYGEYVMTLIVKRGD